MSQASQIEPHALPEDISRGPSEHCSDRYAVGLERLTAIDGRDGQIVVEGLARISPDFARYLVEFPFGDIYARPGLDLRSREIATIAALTALGNARPQLEVHVAAGLNVGLSREEIVEIIMQMAVYAGSRRHKRPDCRSGCIRASSSPQSLSDRIREVDQEHRFNDPAPKHTRIHRVSRRSCAGRILLDK